MDGFLRTCEALKHHCGQVTREDPGPVQDGLRLLVILQIDQPVRQAVGGCKFQEAKGVTAEAGSNDADARARADQQDPALKICPQDGLAHRGVRQHHTAQIVPADLEHFTRLGGHSADKGRLPLDQAQFPEEPSRTVNFEDPRAGAQLSRLSAAAAACSPSTTTYRALQYDEEISCRSLPPV